MAYVDERRRSELPVAGVAIIHVAIGYALLSGLAGAVMHGDPWKPLIIKSIPADHSLPPPPHPKVMPKTPTVPKAWDPTPPPQTPIDVTKGNVDTPTKWIPTVPLEPLPPIDPGHGASATPDKTSGAVAKGDKRSWIREEDYPSSAIRAGDEGAVRIDVTIAANGRVSACTVTGSSGHPALDQATCRLYSARARYAPARDASGTAIAATVSDRVTWQIPR